MVSKSLAMILGIKKNALSIGALFMCIIACGSTYAQASAQVSDDTIRVKSRWLDDYPKHVGLTYTVGADVVANYIWRGIQVAGLGVQPDLAVGYGGAYLDVWGSFNAFDWTFTEPGMYINSPFYPEVDVTVGFARWGLDVKCMFMYYFSDWVDYTQEWRVKYRVSNKLPLHVMWCTRTFGADHYDVNHDDNGNPEKKRAYSSYLELGYEVALPYDMTLLLNLGMTPWKSFYTRYCGNFAVVDIDAKLIREWNVSDKCRINVFGQMMINPYDMSLLRKGDEYYSQLRNKGQQFMWNVGFGVYLR